MEKRVCFCCIWPFIPSAASGDGRHQNKMCLQNVRPFLFRLLVVVMNSLAFTFLFDLPLYFLPQFGLFYLFFFSCVFVFYECWCHCLFVIFLAYTWSVIVAENVEEEEKNDDDDERRVSFALQCCMIRVYFSKFRFNFIYIQIHQIFRFLIEFCVHFVTCLTRSWVFFPSLFCFASAIFLSIFTFNLNLKLKAKLSNQAQTLEFPMLDYYFIRIPYSVPSHVK